MTVFRSDGDLEPGADVWTTLFTFHAAALPRRHTDLIRHFPKSTVPHMTHNIDIKKEKRPVSRTHYSTLSSVLSPQVPSLRH